MSSSIVRSILGSGLAVLTCTLAGQSPEGGDLAAELEALLNTPVESASKRVQKAIESPQAVEVITAEQIKASGVFRLVDVLRLATSVQVWDAVPDRANVTLRGVAPAGNPRTVQLLIDGVPMFNLVAAPLEWNGLPLPVDAIERVEIVRGPSSSLYGANAQTGVIAITTKRAKEGFAGSLRAGGAQDGVFNSQGFAAYRQGAFSLTVGAAGNSRQEQEQRLAFIGNPSLSYDNNIANHGYQAFLRPEIALGENTRIWAEYGKGSAGGQTDYSLSAPAMVGVLQFNNVGTIREIFQVGWAQTWSPTFRTEVKMSQKTFNIHMGPVSVVPGVAMSPTVYALTVAADPAMATDHDFYHDYVRETAIQANWDPSASFHLVAGFDAKDINTGACKTIGLPIDRQASASGGFVSIDWLPIPDLTFSLGARAANESLGGSSTSPRASVVYKIDDASVVRLGYFTSTRSPMVQEFYSAIPLSPIVTYVQAQAVNLKSEKASDFEIGYRRTFSKWSLDLTYFRMTLQDLIATRPTGQVVGGRPELQFANIAEDSTASGFEGSLTGELAPGWLLGINASTSDFKDPLFNLGTQADYSPKASANLWTRVKSGRWFAYAAAQHVGAYTVQTTLATGQVRQEVPAYTALHFNAGADIVRGLSASVYGVNAQAAAQQSFNGALLNQFGIRYQPRELGVQVAYRF